MRDDLVTLPSPYLDTACLDGWISAYFVGMPRASGEHTGTSERRRLVIRKQLVVARKLLEQDVGAIA
jgi:hypothetical protein